MKRLLYLIPLLSLAAHAKNIRLNDHDWSVTDVAEKGLTPERIYDSMNLNIVRVWDSICSNRAQVWAWDFARMFPIKTAKAFLFYTDLNGGKWWYHAANVINHKGRLMVLDAGFPNQFDQPLTLSEWFREFTDETNCREIRATEKGLVRRIFNEGRFPVVTEYGSHNCYYAIAPEGYWTPGQLAKGLLKEDENGRRVSFSRSELDPDEVLEACYETSTSPVGWGWGSGIKKCNYWLNNRPRR